MFPDQNAWGVRFENRDIIVDILDQNEQRLGDEFAVSKAEKFREIVCLHFWMNDRHLGPAANQNSIRQIAFG